MVGKLSLWIVVMDFTHVWDHVKAKYATKAVVHEIAGPGPKGVTRLGDVVSCDIFAYAYVCNKYLLRKLEIGL